MDSGRLFVRELPADIPVQAGAGADERIRDCACMPILHICVCRRCHFSLRLRRYFRRQRLPWKHRVSPGCYRLTILSLTHSIIQSLDLSILILLFLSSLMTVFMQAQRIYCGGVRFFHFRVYFLHCCVSGGDGRVHWSLLEY